MTTIFSKPNSFNAEIVRESSAISGLEDGKVYVLAARTDLFVDAVKTAIKHFKNLMDKEGLIYHYDVCVIDNIESVITSGVLYNAVRNGVNIVLPINTPNVAEKQYVTAKSDAALLDMYIPSMVMQAENLTKKAIEDAITDNNGKISAEIAAAVKTAQDNLQAQIDAINSEIEKIKARLDVIEADINSINQQIAAINGSIDDLKDVDDELEGYISALQTTAADLQSQIDATNTALAALESDLEGQITASEQKVLDELNTVKTALEGKLTTINNTIAIRTNKKCRFIVLYILLTICRIRYTKIEKKIKYPLFLLTFLQHSFIFHKKRGINFNPSFYHHFLKFSITRSTREWNHITDICHTCHKQQQTFKSETEASMRTCTIFACIQIPPHILHRDIQFIDTIHQFIVAFFKFLSGSFEGLDTTAVNAVIEAAEKI